MSKASASELFALFQEEVWKSVMIIDCRPYKEFARLHICGAFCVAVVKDARGRVSIVTMPISQKHNFASILKMHSFNTHLIII
jgi:rhodanese-related sulfurtransferase